MKFTKLKCSYLLIHWSVWSRWWRKMFVSIIIVDLYYMFNVILRFFDFRNAENQSCKSNHKTTNKSIKYPIFRKQTYSIVNIGIFQLNLKRWIDFGVILEAFGLLKPKLSNFGRPFLVEAPSSEHLLTNQFTYIM
jgi:hypothetical protein